MRHNGTMKRTNNRTNSRKAMSNRHHSNSQNGIDGNAPGYRVRGNVKQMLEKYLTLARDASSSGDRIAAEGYLQHAEHYHRLIFAQGTNVVTIAPDSKLSADPKKICTKPKSIDINADESKAGITEEKLLNPN